MDLMSIRSSGLLRAVALIIFVAAACSEATQSGFDCSYGSTVLSGVYTRYNCRWTQNGQPTCADIPSFLGTQFAGIRINSPALESQSSDRKIKVSLTDVEPEGDYVRIHRASIHGLDVKVVTCKAGSSQGGSQAYEFFIYALEQGFNINNTEIELDCPFGKSISHTDWCGVPADPPIDEVCAPASCTVPPSEFEYPCAVFGEPLQCFFDSNECGAGEVAVQDGSKVCCWPFTPRPNSVVCRAADTRPYSCDVAETCDGQNPGCPPDGGASNGVIYKCGTDHFVTGGIDHSDLWAPNSKNPYNLFFARDTECNIGASRSSNFHYLALSAPGYDEDCAPQIGICPNGKGLSNAVYGECVETNEGFFWACSCKKEFPNASGACRCT